MIEKINWTCRPLITAVLFVIAFTFFKESRWDIVNEVGRPIYLELTYLFFVFGILSIASESFALVGSVLSLIFIAHNILFFIAGNIAGSISFWWTVVMIVAGGASMVSIMEFRSTSSN